MPQKLSVELGSEERVTALIYPAESAPIEGVVLILGHGAGASQTSEFIVNFASGLAFRGSDVVTFNFPYMEQGRKYPDKKEKLELCFRTVIRDVRVLPALDRKKLFAGGKSLGGRIASQAVAADTSVAGELTGLVFLGYPLHPPGKPEELRSSHLFQIRIPMLFCQGSRDAFGSPDELRPILERLPAKTRLYVINGGDHSFAVPKRLPPSQEEVHRAVQDEIVSWIREVV